MNADLTESTDALTVESIVALVTDPLTVRLIPDRHVMSSVYGSAK